MGQIYSFEAEHTSPRPNLSPGAEPKVINEDIFLKSLFEQDPKKACEVLFRRHYANLCNHAIRFVYSKDIAEEIVAEVFANFWQGQSYKTISTSFQAYLYQAVRYRAYNYIRMELNRTASLDLVSSASTPNVRPDEVLHYNDLCRKVDGIVQDLPPRCRLAFQMNRIEGKKYSEIATELHISVSAVERLISRALSRLRHELKNDWLTCFLLICIILS